MDFPCLWNGKKINIVQMLAKDIFEFNVTPIKNLMSLFIELEKKPQMLMGALKTPNSSKNLGYKERSLEYHHT